jgi:calcium/calmodulin-dependent 3',5'-cyclic nucleotide phosphodiesterase
MYKSPCSAFNHPEWERQDRVGWLFTCTSFFLSSSGSKSQNCLWNSLIDGLTGNVKEKARPTIVQDTRPPEEILADELPQLDSPEALVKTSFRFGG